MKTSSVVALSLAAVVIAAGAFYFIDIDQTREARLPDVDVSVKGGQAPEFDVKTGEVEVGTTEKEVLVPKVVMEKETVTVPTVDAKPAG